MADEQASARLALPVTRRTLLRTAAGAASIVAATVGSRWLVPQHRVAAEAIETIAEDVVQRGRAFRRGERRGVDLVEVADDADRSELVASQATGMEQSFLSEPVRLDFPITDVGAHWRATSAGGWLAVDLRFSWDGQTWTEWTTPPVERFDGEAPRRGVFAALAAAGGATHVQYRVRFDSRGGPIRLRRVTLTCLNSVDGVRRRVWLPASDGALAAVPRPSIVTRAGWGCNENYRFANGQEIWPRRYYTCEKIVIHHTATTNSYADAAAQVRSIYYYHAVTQGWGDIGYHALIGNDGRIYEGRKGRDNWIVDPDVEAGHVIRCNRRTMGISFIGNFMSVAIPSNMLDAGARIAAWACDLRGIDPLGSGVYVDADGRSINIANISGHRQIASPSYPTACPGDTGVTQLPDFRQRTANVIASSVTPTATPTRTPTLTPTATATLTATATATVTPSPTTTGVPASETATATPDGGPPPTETATPEPTATDTATSTPTSTPPPTTTATPQPTATVTPQPTATAAPSAVYQIVRSGRSSNSTVSTAIYDRDLGTYWATNVSSPPRTAYVFVDLGEVKPIGKVRWYFAVSGWAPEYLVQISADRKTWTTVHTGRNPSAGVWRARSVGRDARYVRWYFRNTNGSPRLGGLAEVQVRR